MTLVTQDKALDVPGSRGRVRFWRVERREALDGLVASFVTRTYVPHSHDAFVVGVITNGAETFQLRGAKHVALAGALCFINPGEVHDGVPTEGGYVYRMSYPSEALLRAVAAEASAALTRRRPISPSRSSRT